MATMSLRSITLSAAIVALLLVVASGVAADRSVASDGASIALEDGAGGWTAQAAPDAQDGGSAAAENDTRVPVQVWTVLAAVSAAGVGLVLFLVRLTMGWVKPPPAPPESEH
jgi:hypothetical protein